MPGNGGASPSISSGSGFGNEIPAPWDIPGTTASSARGDFDTNSFYSSLNAAKVKLGALMGVANIGIKGAPLGGSFGAKYSADVNALVNPPSADDNSTNGYDRMLASVKAQVAELALEAAGASKTSQAVEELKVQHTLTAAAMKAGIPVTDNMQAQWKTMADAIAAYNIQIKQAQVLNEQTFNGMTQFMSPSQQAAANAAHQIDPTNWQAHLQDAGPQMAALNSQLRQAADLSYNFVDTFNQGLIRSQGFVASLTSALQGLESQLLQMADKALVNAAFGGVLSLLGGSAPLSLSAGNYGGMAGILSPLHHSGYGPGDPAVAMRFVHPAYFENAPRFHSGIGPGEMPAIIRRDESVLTSGQMRAMGSPKVNVVINNNAAGISVTPRADGDGLTIDIVDARIDGKIKGYDKRLPDRVAAINLDPRRRGV